MKFETAHDRALQQAIAARVAEEWHCEWGPMGPMGAEFAPIDVYMTCKKTLVAMVEIKTRRNCKMSDLSVVLIDMTKWRALWHVERRLHLKGMYVVGFVDGIFAMRIQGLPGRYPVRVYGRTDRGYSKDQHPAVVVPSCAFDFVTSADGLFEEER